jgi:hypothetical protein
MDALQRSHANTGNDTNLAFIIMDVTDPLSITKFTDQYPEVPPTVQLKTSITRQHVFGEYICLDMLHARNGDYLHREDYYGWSSSYTVLSILLQLQSFLLDKQDSDHSNMMFSRKEEQIKKDVLKSQQFRQCTCQHQAPQAPWPYEEHWEPLINFTMSLAQGSAPNAVSKTTTSKKKRSPKCFSLDLLSDDVILLILDFMHLTELSGLSSLGERWHNLTQSDHLWARRELICFHSKVTFEEDVLGIGISLQYTNKGKLSAVHTPMDLMSRSAFFEQNIRHSVWNKPIKHWIPLYINREHASRALPTLFEDCVRQVYNGIKVLTSNGESTHVVVHAIDLLCKLMSSMVVEIMKGNTHASLKALEYYCHFHRLLIYYVETYPGLLESIDDKIRRFMTFEQERHKDHLANLGEFLPLLSVASYRWTHVAKYVVAETMDRNALWVKLRYPMLSYIPRPSDPIEKHCKEYTREQHSWECQAVGARLLMFHVFFLEKVTGRGQVDGPELLDIAYEYDQRYGKPTKEIQEAMQQAIFEIQEVSSYEEFFNYVGVPVPRYHTVYGMLCKAMLNMKRKKYHVRKEDDSAKRGTDSSQMGLA